MRIYPFLFCFILLQFHSAFAKTGENFNFSAGCFVENKGQITDQHYSPRKDIDFKLESTND